MGTIAHSGSSTRERLQHAWRDLREAEPGERFKQRFRRKQRERGGKRLRKAVYILAGLAVSVVGVVFLPAPGPGSLLVLLGAAIVAQESYFAAAALDRMELAARQLLAWAARRRKHLHPLGKALLSLAAIAAAVLLALIVYRALA